MYGCGYTLSLTSCDLTDELNISNFRVLNPLHANPLDKRIASRKSGHQLQHSDSQLKSFRARDSIWDDRGVVVMMTWKESQVLVTIVQIIKHILLSTTTSLAARYWCSSSSSISCHKVNFFQVHTLTLCTL